MSPSILRRSGLVVAAVFALGIMVPAIFSPAEVRSAARPAARVPHAREVRANANARADRTPRAEAFQTRGDEAFQTRGDNGSLPPAT